MVKCPRCDSEMHYIHTDSESECVKEGVISLKADAHYNCAICFSDLTLRYEQEVILK